MRNQMILSKIILSITGGLVLAALLLTSHSSFEDFFYSRESVSLLHLSFGLTFLVVLFWVGFFVTWVFYSLIVWSTETVRYNIRYRSQEEEGEQKTMQLSGPTAETAPGTQRHVPEISAEHKTVHQEPSIPDDQGEEAMLTSEEFSILIKDSGLTISQVAEKLGVSRQMVSYIIHGKRDMTKRISRNARTVLRHPS